jgi:hypothetical protein
LESVYTWDLDNDNSGISVGFGAANNGAKAAGSYNATATTGPAHKHSGMTL